jgi:thiol-disulfide isomerase/thioredoxin
VVDEFAVNQRRQAAAGESGDRSPQSKERHISEVNHYRIAVAAVVLVVGSLFPTISVAAQSRTARSSQSAHKPRSSPATKLPAAARPINGEELQGLLKRDGTRPLLVNYWATWCDPCRDEFPDLVKIDKQYGPQGLEFIAITLDDLADLKTAVPKFLRLMNAKMPVYLLNVVDPEPTINSVDRDWGGALPATFLYNNKGEVVYKHFGRIKTDELRAAIEKLVGSKDLKAEGTKQ